MTSSSFLILNWGTALLSAGCLQAEVLEDPQAGRNIWEGCASKSHGLHCHYTLPPIPGKQKCMFCCPSLCNPSSHSCIWAGWQQERQLLCSVERMSLSKYWPPRSIWEIIQLRNNTDVLSGNWRDCFRQLTPLHSFSLWPPLEMHSHLSTSFNCWWEPPTENNPLHFDRDINQAVLHTQSICCTKPYYAVGCAAE